jgi:hypothetical protein
MDTDPTLQEIWDARQKIWEECGGSFENLLEYYRKAQNEHPHKIIRLEEVLVE